MSEENPFEKFIVDENQPIDKKLVAEIIEPYVETIGKNQIIEYTEKFENLIDWIKTAIYLCCRKVMLSEGIVKTEEVGPKQISEYTGIGLSSAKQISINKNLQKIVVKKKTKYYIPNYKLKKLKKMLKENEKSKRGS